MSKFYTKTIVVIDDDPTTLAVIEGILWDYQLVLCQRSTQLLGALGSDYPSLIIMDVFLEGRSGIDVISTVKGFGFDDIPVLFISADDSSANVSRASAIPNAKFLSKSELSADVLLDVVRSMIGKPVEVLE